MLAIIVCSACFVHLLWASKKITSEKYPIVSKIQSKSSKCQISVGICSYQGVKTIAQTLNSYQKFNLFDAADEIILLDQGNRPEIRDLVRGFAKIRYKASSNFKFHCVDKLMHLLKCKYVLFLEEDFKLTANASQVELQINQALKMLSLGLVRVVRLRSRRLAGYPNWAHMTYIAKGNVGKLHALHSVHWFDDPSLHYDHIFKCGQNPSIWCSKFPVDFTLNPFISDRLWWIQNVTPLFTGDEGKMSENWASLGHNVAQGEGLFTHDRLDR